MSFELPVTDDPRRLRREVKVLSLVVERIRGRGLHEESRLDPAQEIAVWSGARIEAHVDHANDREVLPALRAGRADRDRDAERSRRLARREVADEDALVDELRAHRRNAVV